MEVHVEFPRLLQIGFKLVGHRVQQYRLATSHTVIVETKYGQVRGLKRKTVYDEEFYYAFEGIPYAKPPVGELRFRAPEPPEAWKGVRDCTTYSEKPLQRHMVLGTIEGSENCLYLNVYAKRMQTEKPLPVIVWIYGGGFQKGEASRDIYSPDYFMKQPVVMVTINYRLGALGFLSLKDPKLNVPGNAGLKDQVLALRWISENIAHFNGDPNNITLMGESAGAASTHIMMTTEQTRGLFHKAILQSGCALAAWADMPNRNWGYRLAYQMGYQGSEEDADVLQFLCKAPARQIASSDQDIVTLDEVRNFYLVAFGPTVEPYESEQCVVPRQLKKMQASAWGNNIPLIIGGNSFEGLFFSQVVSKDPWVLTHFDNIIPREVSKVSTPEQLQHMVRRLKHVYFGDEQRQCMELLEALYIFSHREVWHDLHRTVMARLAYAPGSATYLYRFDFDSPHFNQFRRLACGNQVRGVCHADELSYLFYNLLATKLNKSSLEYRTIERMVGMWTAFAASSDPNCPATDSAQWTPVELTSNRVHNCYNISEEMQMMALPEAAILAVWDTFYEKDALY
ncbi:esterase B1 [Drosophila grimshawi]|uniref:carboxylesterase n=1 Tax=Drosophila grimshawi TaxID=7222 RepID=B4JF79_DROGR|nr:esterase B1 [Drosophila grimshawi]EDV93360.1 GH18314 [Drosophila grimshawi]